MTTTDTTLENIDVATVAAVVIVATAVSTVALESKETSAIFIRSGERRSLRLRKHSQSIDTVTFWELGIGSWELSIN